MNNYLKPLRSRREELAGDSGRVWDILEEGTENARSEARRTMADVRAALKLQADQG